MELQTISQVSRQLGISTRTLRYYEQIGLIKSAKKEDFSYRAYDENTIVKLKQIIVLRKLRIPLKQIADIIKSDNVKVMIESFQQNLNEIEDELTALTTIKNVIQSFIERLNITNEKLLLLDDESLLEIVDSLTASKINFKEDKNLKEEHFQNIELMSAERGMKMEDLNKASEKLSRLTDKDVRIVYLPPATMAAYQYVGDEPEMHVHQVLDKFVRDSDLIHIKPDARHFGFNAPNPVDETGYHGYEVWVTIPDDMNVPKPIVKKQFEGGLYAAHMIPFGAFEEWEWLNEWLTNSNKYEYRGNWAGENMFGWLEEHLNYHNHAMLENTEPEGLQLDLLIPIKERVK